MRSPPVVSHLLASTLLLTSSSRTTLTAASGALQACSHHGFLAFVLPRPLFTQVLTFFILFLQVGSNLTFLSTLDDYYYHLHSLTLRLLTLLYYFCLFFKQHFSFSNVLCNSFIIFYCLSPLLEDKQ